MTKKNDPISLDDSVLLTGFSEAEVRFIQDNEEPLHRLISIMTEKQTAVITLDVQSREIKAFNTTTREEF